jgi:glutathione S-transferase
MITLWGRITSVNVQKAVFALGELGLAYERKEAGGAFGIVETPEYRSMNPNGLVPVLQDDGLVMWESNAIVRYVAARYGQGSLWAEEPRERALADQWLDWQQTMLNPSLGPAFHGLVRTPPEKRDMAAIDASRAKTEAALAILDAHLAGRDWLAGEGFSMAECVVGASVHRWLNMPVQRETRPNVERWYGSWRSRPAALAALPLPIA